MIITSALQLYISLQVLAIIAFIITFKSFNNLADKGYCISKVLGLIMSGFISWLIMSFNFGAFKLTPLVSYISGGIFLLISILIFFLLYSKEDKKDIFSFIDKRYKFVLFVELSFLAIFILCTYINCFAPDILAVNKLQELVYIKSILASNSLPPDNLWFSGYKINYYYAGYFMLANLINLTGIEIHSAFNLIASMILALIAISSGGLIYNITNRKFYGFMGAIITGFMTNYIVLKQIIIAGVQDNFDWWATAHGLPNGTFTEPPFWSMVLGDIEPFFIIHIFTIALIYLIYTIIKDNILLTTNNITSKSITTNIILIVIIAMTITCNILSILSTMLIIILAYLYLMKNSKEKVKNAVSIVVNLIGIFFIAIIIDLPFLLNYKFPGFTTTNIDKTSPDYLTGFLYTFGCFLLPFIIYGLIELKKILKLSYKEPIFMAIALISILEIFLLYKSNVSIFIISLITALILLFIFISSINIIFKDKDIKFHKTFGSIIGILFLFLIIYMATKSITIVIAGIISILFAYIAYRKDDLTIYTALCLALTGFILIFLSNTNTDFSISNTNTLAGYLLSQTILLFLISLTIIIFEIITKYTGTVKDIMITLISIILLPCFLFSFIGPYYKTNKINIIPDLVPKLSGINHLKVFHKADYDAIKWLQNNANSNNIILEAVNPATQLSGRVSAYSGLTALINSLPSQLFSYGEFSKATNNINNRIEDIDRIYGEKDKTNVKDLIKSYNINYIFVGELEIEKYGKENLDTFKDNYELVFTAIDENNKESFIYKAN
ncbi:MAG: DUF2298 domain-containing protein [Cyanobacteriota bacterium]